MPRLFQFFASTLCVFFCYTGLACAAQPGNVLEQQQQILRQQQERQQQLERERRELQNRPPQGLDVPLLEKSEPQSDAQCVDIHRLEIQGATLLGQRFISDLRQEHENRCLNLAQINNITKNITNEYTRLGYVTSRALLGPQDLSTGVLIITVVEGTIEKFVPGPDSGIDPRQLIVIFPGLSGGVLNLRDIEQGLDQMNRLASNNASMRIEPGEQFGSSIVVIDNTPAKSWRAGIGVDNTGQKSTGQHQVTFSFDKDNYIGSFDTVSLGYTRDIPRSKAFNNGATGHNDSFNAYVSIPYGYWTLSSSLNLFSYSMKVFGLWSDYENSGETSTFKLMLDRVIHRDASSKTTIGTFVKVHDVKNFFEGVKLHASSYILGTGGLSIAHSRRLWDGFFSVRLEHVIGLDHFGTKRDQDRNLSSPRSQFHKTTASVQWHKPFLIGEQELSFDTALSGQTSPHTLYGSERFTLGSLYTVRGFEGSPLSGDQGFTLRNELALKLPMPSIMPAFVTSKLMSSLQAYVAYDIGALKRDRRDPYERGTLQGAAIGLRSQGPLSFDISYATALASPKFVRHDDGVFSASVRYTF